MTPAEISAGAGPGERGGLWFAREARLDRNKQDGPPLERPPAGTKGPAGRVGL